jgi:hypothetical protein
VLKTSGIVEVSAPVLVSASVEVSMLEIAVLKISEVVAIVVDSIEDVTSVEPTVACEVGSDKASDVETSVGGCRFRRRSRV